ncbi:MAG: hypothetical protein HYZ81_10255 [Nitrospinae bacterium]|nr:hypothetical protein [Nitrospinota bacterium]
MRMKHQLVVVFVLTLVAALVGSALAQAGMMGPGMGGGQAPAGQSPQAKEDKPSEQPGQMPMPPDFAARMMNACVGAMEGMAQMGRMMGGMGGQMGTSPKPSEQRQ